MGKLKKLRKQSEKLAYRVQIAEQQQRLAELQQQKSHFGFHVRSQEQKGTLMPEQATKAFYKGIEEHVFRSDDIHSLMELVSQQKKAIPPSPEASGYIDFLQSLEDKVTAVWLDICPGQEAVCTIREEKE